MRIEDRALSIVGEFRRRELGISSASPDATDNGLANYVADQILAAVAAAKREAFEECEGILRQFADYCRSPECHREDFGPDWATTVDNLAQRIRAAAEKADELGQQTVWEGPTERVAELKAEVAFLKFKARKYENALREIRKTQMHIFEKGCAPPCHACVIDNALPAEKADD